jgi:ATP-binding cassette subfamily F protein uup
MIGNECEDQTVLETVNDTHLLGRFMFPHEMMNNKIRKLSGGEKRRLYLLTILMRQPNLLVMDEPTNDLDIVTLNVLEEYLREYKGTLIIVSHDRHFLDRLVEHIFIINDDGTVKDFVGSYSQYRALRLRSGSDLRLRSGTDLRLRSGAGEAEGKAAKGTLGDPQSPANGESKPRKLTYKEQRELETLEKDIEALTAEKEELETKLQGGITEVSEIQKVSERFSEVSSLLDAAETRWLELSI